MPGVAHRVPVPPGVVGRPGDRAGLGARPPVIRPRAGAPRRAGVAHRPSARAVGRSGAEDRRRTAEGGLPGGHPAAPGARVRAGRVRHAQGLARLALPGVPGRGRPGGPRARAPRRQRGARAPSDVGRPRPDAGAAPRVTRHAAPGAGRIVPARPAGPARDRPDLASQGSRAGPRHRRCPRTSSPPTWTALRAAASVPWSARTPTPSHGTW